MTFQGMKLAFQALLNNNNNNKIKADNCHKIRNVSEPLHRNKSFVKLECFLIESSRSVNSRGLSGRKPTCSRRLRSQTRTEEVSPSVNRRFTAGVCFALIYLHMLTLCVCVCVCRVTTSAEPDRLLSMNRYTLLALKHQWSHSDLYCRPGFGSWLLDQRQPDRKHPELQKLSPNLPELSSHL